MRNMTFEDKLFRQRAYWVGGLTVDMLRLEVRLSLIANPDTHEINGVVTFEDCKQFTGIFHDSEVYDPDYTPSLLGIMDQPEGQQTRYIITADTVEISFTTPVEPKVQWMDPNSQRRPGHGSKYAVERHEWQDKMTVEDVMAQIQAARQGEAQ